MRFDLSVRVGLVFVLALVVARAADVPPPKTPMRPVVDRIHGVEFVDPYRWLERQDDREVRQWIAAQNAYADLIVPHSAERGRLGDRLRRLMGRPEIGRTHRGGGFEYFTLRRSGAEQTAIFRRPVPEDASEPIDPEQVHEFVIAPRDLSADLTTSPDVLAVTPSGDRLIYSLRDGGQDERAIVVRNLKTRRDTERLPAALYDSVSLRKDGAGFFYVRRSRETGARVRFHAWGTPVERDPVLFGDGYGPTAFVSMSQSDDGKRFLFTVQHGWARSEVWLKDATTSAAPQAVVKDVDAHFYPRFVKDELWMRTDFEAPMGRAVTVDLVAPGARDRWRTVLPERADVLEDVALIGDRMYATYLRDVSNRILVFDREGTPRGEIEVPDLASASIRADGENVILTIESFTTPETTYRLDLASGTRTVEQGPWPGLDWDPSPFAVERVYGASKDGTKVPIFVVGRKDRPRDHSNRVLLFGYGGFNVAQKPRFSPIAAAWLESGGVYASAVLRGGSEFGEAWHRGGMLTNKQHVFDDFIAAAEALIANGTTRPELLAIHGTSNGGLLVGATLTQRPDLVRAVLCGFPDVDILRFNQYTRNNNMPALLEYGDAAIPEQFEAIRRFSPYQQVKPGTAYPAVMIWSGDLDTRVPPIAARKFTAALQAASTSGRPVILRYYAKAGHATNNGLPFSTRVDLVASQLAFLQQELKDARVQKP